MTDRTITAAADLTLRQQVRLLSGQDLWHTQALPEAGIPAVLVSDGPHGLRTQLGAGDHLGLGGSEPATCFPPAVTLGSTWDPALAHAVGVALAEEALDLGVGVVLGPGINIKRHPLGGRSFEYLSEDPLLSGRIAAATVTGIQSLGVGTSLKHFAVNSQESHRFTYSAVVDDRTLRELYLRAFEIVVTEAAPWTVMCSYNAVNGTPASQHRWLLTEVLRDEWGFDGLVMSDWGAVVDRVAGIAAGLDLEMPGSRSLSDREVVEAVRSGRLDATAVRTSAQRVLDLVARTHPSYDATPGSPGSHGSPGSPGSHGSPGSPAPMVRDVDAHDALARQVAAAGTVLLTNDGILPLAAGVDLAVIGAFAERPRYQGAGSSAVTPTRLTSLLDALGERGLTASYAPGYALPLPTDDAALIDEAVTAARAATVAVVLVGLPGALESEGFDREHLRLPRQHDRLVEAVCAANPRTVVVLSNGAPVELPWRDRPAALLESYLGGQAGGAALLDVLLGDAEPGGRLAESFPVDQHDVAADPWFGGRPRQVDYREGLFVGYRHHTTAGVAPAYAFGHGLSYTTFEWRDAELSTSTLPVRPDGTVDDVVVSLTVTNTGPRAGSDVVQVYRDDRTGVVLRPRRELVGFTKVHLEPGESRRTDVAVDGRGLAFWETRDGEWRVPDGPVALEVGRSSETIDTILLLTVTGGVTSASEGVGAPAVAGSDADFATRLGRPVPTPVPSRPFTRDSTIEELAQTHRGRVLGTLLERLARSAVDDGDDGADGADNLLVERSLREIPLRSFAAFSGGRLPWPVVDSLLDAVDGRYRSLAGRGLGVVASLLGRRR